MESVFTILQSIVPNEFPIILYQYTNYIGNPRLIFDFDSKIINNDIKSLYIPPHLKLDLYSHHGNKCTIYGASIPNLQALMLFWDDGTRLDFSQVSYIIPKQTSSWKLYLHNLLSKKQNLLVNDKIIQFDKDEFFSNICTTSPHQYKCDCFNTFVDLSLKHPNMDLFIDLLNPKCQPRLHYTHSKSLIASNTKNREQLCISMFNNMIHNNTLKPWELGGPEYFSCDSHYYTNVLIPDKTKRFDDEQDKLIESQEMPSNIGFIYFLLILLFFFIVYLSVLACHYFHFKYVGKKMKV